MVGAEDCERRQCEVEEVPGEGHEVRQEESSLVTGEGGHEVRQ